jgi:hypothetical protein
VFTTYKDRVDKDNFAGQRAAVFMHRTNSILVPRFQQRHYRDYHNIGNFDAYLFREQDFENGEEITFIFNYFRWHFKEAANNNPYNQTWINDACKNLVSIWNDTPNKQYVSLFHEKDSVKHRIKIRFHIEHVAKPNQHTIINVHPAGTDGRSSMGRNSGNIRSDETVRDTDNKCVAAHEFGHAASLDDDYHEIANYCSYWQRGFVDFKPGAPFSYDTRAMMNTNRYVQSRYFWQFAIWMYNEFIKGQKTEFTVIKKNEHPYKLPYNPANTGDPRDLAKESKTYYNFPAKTIRRGFNTKTNKGLFDIHLYPLGKDSYSQNTLLSGKKFTGLTILVVNLRFKFWDSADYDDIVDTLDYIETSINENIIKKSALKLCGDPPYQDTYIRIQPRYLVENYTSGFTSKLDNDINTSAKYSTLVTQISNKPEGKTHFKVNVSNPFFGTWFTDTKWNGTHTVDLVKGDRKKFWRYFCEMLGLKHKEIPSTTNFTLPPLVSSGTIKNC